MTKMILFIMISLTLINADERENSDREISVRKAVDSFTRIEQKEIFVVDKFKYMFSEGKVTGQVRSMYAGYNQEKSTQTDTYATAVGGTLKYELASFNGFNAGVAFTTSNDIGFITGNNTKQNNELSSEKGSYTVVSEAYLNYQNNGFNFRAGRQIIDTPLVDSDDARMIPNTFEAYMLTYKIEDMTFSAGNIQRWQGAGAGLGYDNGVRLDTQWLDMEDNGIWFAGASYDGLFEANAWYYDVPTLAYATKASYFDFGSHTDENQDLSIHGAIQYLYESESKGSGVQASIYGALVEVVVHGVGLNLAYNKSNQHGGKKSFAGIGGGSLYTSMDTMALDEITEDRSAKAIVFGLVYSVDDLEFLYAYGDFDGDENSARQKAHRVEQDIGLQYSVNDAFTVAAIYVKEEDKLSSAKTINDWDRFQVMVKYDF